MDRSKSVVTPQRFASGMTFDYVEYAAMYEKDRIRAHQNAQRSGETAEQSRARSDREFADLQASPFFQIWQSAAIDTMLSLLHARLVVGPPA